MTDGAVPAPPTSPGPSPAAGPLDWVRAHVTLVAGAAAGVVILILVVIIVAMSGSGGGGGSSITPGAIVGTGPLTSGYRISGTVTKVGAASLVVKITALDAESADARNVVLQVGSTMEFDRPAEGAVALARNGHRITTASQVHKGDTVVLVGEFTSVQVPPAPAHDGYAYIGVEASSK
jgi:hypothetical protein